MKRNHRRLSTPVGTVILLPKNPRCDWMVRALVTSGADPDYSYNVSFNLTNVRRGWKLTLLGAGVCARNLLEWDDMYGKTIGAVLNHATYRHGNLRFETVK